MTKAGRIGNVFAGLIIIVFGILTALAPTDAYRIIILILSLSMLLAAIRLFIYYVSMARHMVGGRSILYRAVLMFDIGLFSLSLANVPLIVLVLYLAGVHGFSGGIDIMRAMESKRMQAPSWKLAMCHGIVNVLLAALCLAFLQDTAAAVTIYSVGLIYSGVMRIIQAFRRTAVVYIN